MPAPQEVLDLVARFEENLGAYASGAYNETQLRREFIDPLFRVLGWDLDNVAGHAEAYKDVIHEDAIRIGCAMKAPDYCFRIGGTRKFFVEAKKPAVRIAEDATPAYQLRRYAWSAGLPLSILTNFEEFAVYDCRIKPDQNDRPATARILFFSFRDYDARWGEITAVFAKEAVLKGAFDRYAESTRLKKGTAGVDDAFLMEIESWRDLLARTIALRNPALSQRELNTAVTLTINRIIFLRICEDRGIEPYGQLQGLLNGSGVYKRLIEIFQRADDRYNSGLFHFRQEKNRTAPPDNLTLGLAIDDKALKEILRGLYYPESPYEFSVLPADILGRVYEQFLGKIIRLTAGHQAKVEDKPEVKMEFRRLAERYPQTAAYLMANRKKLESREKGKFKYGQWHRFGRNQNIGIQNRVKLCVPRLVNHLYAAYDAEGRHYLDNVDVGGVVWRSMYQNQGFPYLFGILNSKLLRWYFPFVSAPFRGGWMSANRQFLSQLPIHPIDFADPADRERHDRMVSLVEEMLALHRRLAAVRTDHEQANLKRQIDATDSRIDRLVYDLYDLTEEEIRIVEKD